MLTKYEAGYLGGQSLERRGAIADFVLRSPVFEILRKRSSDPYVKIGFTRALKQLHFLGWARESADLSLHLQHYDCDESLLPIP
ncbi:hypothetical protein, partial [Enterobacter cloacae]|uniref:hypothetical protein n=1 Tax=Enterobacter cloacae TaxID=550 RepID=UPI0028DF3BD0